MSLLDFEVSLSFAIVDVQHANAGWIRTPAISLLFYCFSLNILSSLLDLTKFKGIASSSNVARRSMSSISVELGDVFKTHRKYLLVSSFMYIQKECSRSSLNTCFIILHFIFYMFLYTVGRE